MSAGASSAAALAAAFASAALAWAAASLASFCFAVRFALSLFEARLVAASAS